MEREVLHRTEAETIRDIDDLLARVRAGAEVIIRDHYEPLNPPSWD